MSLLCCDCCYVGDSKSFPQPNDKVVRRYYCNCGDSEYYEKDITGIEIKNCESFEEV